MQSFDLDTGPKSFCHSFIALSPCQPRNSLFDCVESLPLLWKPTATVPAPVSATTNVSATTSSPLTRHPHPTAARCAWSHRVLPSHLCRAAMRSSVRLAWIRLSTWLSTAVVLSATDALTRCYAFLLRVR